MRFIRDIFATTRDRGRPVISFEFFPPKTDEGQAYLLDVTIPTLIELLGEGVSGLHFYALNKTRSVARIVRGLGLIGSASASVAPGMLPGR